MGNFWGSVKDIGMLGVNYLTPATAALTGKSTSDLLGYDMETKLGQTANNLSSNLIGTLAPTALNAVAPGAGTALNAVQGVAPSLIGQVNPSDPTSLIPRYRNGGIVRHDKVNIEKNELCVNPVSGEIVDDYDEAPKHPKNGVNPRGNRYVDKGHAIIPAAKREAYLKGDYKERMKIISSLPSTIPMTRKLEDGFNPTATNPYLPQFGGLNPFGLSPQATSLADYQTPEYFAQGTSAPATSNSTDSNMGGGNDFNWGKAAPAAMLGASVLPQIIYGNQQRKVGLEGLKKLEGQPAPNFGITPEMNILKNQYSAAQGRAQYGFDAGQRNAFNQQAASLNNTRFQNALGASDGRSSAAINAALTSGNLLGFNTFALNDAQLKQQKTQYADRLGSDVASTFTNQRNRATQVDINNRNAKEQAYGKALQDGRTNIVNGISTGLSGIAGNLAGSNMFSYVGNQGAKTPPTQQQLIDLWNKTNGVTG